MGGYVVIVGLCLCFVWVQTQALSGLGSFLTTASFWHSVHLCMFNRRTLHLAACGPIQLSGLPSFFLSQSLRTYIWRWLLLYSDGRSVSWSNSLSLFRLLSEVDLLRSYGHGKIQAPSKAYSWFCICNLGFFFKRGLPRLFKLQIPPLGYIPTKSLFHKLGFGSLLPAHRQLCASCGQPPWENWNVILSPRRCLPPCRVNK